MNTAPQAPRILGPEQTRQVAVVCESTSCLPAELIRRYNIGIIPIPFVFGSETFLDGVDITPSEFYARLVASQTPPKTSPPSPGEYLRAWKEAAGQAAPGEPGAPGAPAPSRRDEGALGRAVVLVTVADTISTLQRSAQLARAMAPETLPGIPVAVVDSLSAGMGQGFVVLAAARSAADGQPLEVVVAAAERVRRRIRMLVTLDTLDYLARTSRIPQVAAFVGGLLAIKPVVELSGGDVRLLKRVRTRRRSIEELFDQVQQTVPAGARLHAAVQHAQAAEEAVRFEERIRATFDCVELFTTEFTPVMGGYCGPGLLGIAFYHE